MKRCTRGSGIHPGCGMARPPVMVGQLRRRPRSTSPRDGGPDIDSAQPVAGARPRRDFGTPVLLERERELSEIDRLIGISLAGEGRLLVIHGRAGLGKSALLAELRSRAARRGMSVCAGRGTERESGFAFGLVRQLFEPAVRRSGNALFEGAASLAAPVFGVSARAAGEAQLSAFHGLYWLAADLA